MASRQHTQRHREMRGEDVIAEDMVVDGGEPVGKRRLFQIADAVDLQRDPVAGERHVLRGIGVGGVGIIQQRRREERRKIDGEPDQQQDRPGASREKESARVQYRSAPEVRWDET